MVRWCCPGPPLLSPLLVLPLSLFLPQLIQLIPRFLLLCFLPLGVFSELSEEESLDGVRLLPCDVEGRHLCTVPARQLRSEPVFKWMVIHVCSSALLQYPQLTLVIYMSFI